MTRTEAIKAFLTARTHPDLSALYDSGMECQVNVAQDGGSRITGEFHGKNWHGYTDGTQTWKPIRIPRNAHSTPEYQDVPMKFSLESHAEAIGMTGWDWKNKVSRWVAFDFDAIAGHKETHKQKVSTEDLEAVRITAGEIPWVTTRKSAGGKGLHLYVFIDPPEPTQNHNEHAALARAILGKMSALTRFDFESKVDICGHNMWVWHRKMLGNDGLALIKQGEPLREIPPQWKDHVKVITGHQRKTLPRFISDEDSNSDAEKWFAELTSQTPRIPLDEEHKRLIQWLEAHQRQAWWDADHHMLVTHTFDLKEAHEELRFRGIFHTNATGKEKGHDHNCFAFPMRRGSWAIRRYSMGAQEHSSWDQDGRGWTRCYYNHDPDLKSSSRAHGGVEDTDGGFVFKEAEIAADAGKAIGARISDIPRALATRKAALKEHRDGRLIMSIEGDSDSDSIAGREMLDKGWLKKKDKWIKIFNIPMSAPMEAEVGSYDDMVRHLTTGAGDDYGWVIKGEGTDWRTEPLIHVKTSLESLNIPIKDIKGILGSSILKPWKIVNRPFQPEFPGDRQWNRGAAQLKYVPTSETEDLKYPTWMKILVHCGQGLDEALKNHPWAKANGITKGADYLKIWVASLFKEPYEPLPYLFFYGPENSGKSIFHEALSLLFTRGYTRADTALINQSGFNEELANAILCVIEEINLKKSKDAANRIKDFVTAREISIHPKGRTPYHIPNTTHWVQCSNDSQACPTFPGDTRITMAFVESMPVEDMIPKKTLLPMLEKEAPDFLAEVLRLEIPPSNDRLNVPVIATAQKLEAQRANETMLQTFIRERCYDVPGMMIRKTLFFEQFTQWCPDPNELAYWTKHKISKEFPSQYPQGRNRKDGHHNFGNISFDAYRPGDPVLKRLRAVVDGKESFLEPEE